MLERHKSDEQKCTGKREVLKSAIVAAIVVLSDVSPSTNRIAQKKTGKFVHHLIKFFKFLFGFCMFMNEFEVN